METDNTKNLENIPGSEDEDQGEPKPGGSSVRIPQEINPLDNSIALKTIQKLPSEVLAELFSYLTHTEKLISRLVCKRWNDEICYTLRKKSYFELKSTESHETLQESVVQWEKIRISQSKFKLTKEIKNNIKTLQLDIPGVGLGEYTRLVSGFPSLTNLDVKINQDIPHPYKPKKTVQARAYARRLNNKIKTCMGKLEILSVTFPFVNFRLLNSFLDKFNNKKMSLTKLSIKEDDKRHSHNKGEGFDFPISQIFGIISKSSQTLKSLTLNFCSISGKCQLYSELVSKLTTLKDLKLETVWFSPSSGSKITQRYYEDNFLNYSTFLKTQLATINEMTLPRRWKTDMYQEFIRCIPRGIKSLGIVHEGHIIIIEEFYTNVVQDLEFMSIVSRPLEATPMFNQPCPSIRKLQLSLTDDNDNEFGYFFPNFILRGEDFYSALGTVFINLVELYITGCSCFMDEHLRLIWENENLKHIKVLLVEDACYISDYGVTGVNEEYSKDVVKTRRLCINPVPDIPKQYDRHGIRLSSLKTLEKLVLTGTSITDFGIYYGLQFGPALKHLTFGTTEKISDWGLHWLGAGNPGLEALHASFDSETVSTFGVENLRRQLPMLESTKKFKLINNKE